MKQDKAERAPISRHMAVPRSVSVAAALGDGLSSVERASLARSVDDALASQAPGRQLLIDVSTIARKDDRTGVQRVIRALMRELLQSPPPGYSVEPVYLSHEPGGWRYRYARRWASHLFASPFSWSADEPIRWRSGDKLLIADLTGLYAIGAVHDGLYDRLKSDGVEIHLIVYDLLPMQMPEYVPPVGFIFPDWLTALTKVVDGVVCISRAVVKDMRTWLAVAAPHRLEDLPIGWFHLGADIEASTPTLGVPIDFDRHLAKMTAAPTFLMVGTIEPRKGHLQTIDAFDRLWSKGVDVNLVVVGRIGWKILREEHRRNIPQIEERLRSHPQAGKRLMWFEDASDELLDRVYAACACLIAASEGEGFGLPLIEAAQHGVPIIARDMPVFREVAGRHAFYFAGVGSRALAKAIEQWLEMRQTGAAPASTAMPRLTWAESAQMLVNVLESHSPRLLPGARTKGNGTDKTKISSSYTADFDERATKRSSPKPISEASEDHLFPHARYFIKESTCSAKDFFHPKFNQICRLLDMEPVFHRKLWEFCYIVDRLEGLGLLKPGVRGLGFGVGAEPLPSAFASRGVAITATDAPREIGVAAGWESANQFAETKEKLFFPRVIDREEFEERVSFSICDMNNIDASLSGFDFCWSACCFEHLGSLSAGLAFVENSVEKTLRPGGVACHTTEFNCSADGETIESGPTVLYRRKDLEDFCERMRRKGHDVEEFRASKNLHSLDSYIDLPPYQQSPHLKLQMEKYTITSAGIMIRRRV